jgi:hypothetical protein
VRTIRLKREIRVDSDKKRHTQYSRSLIRLKKIRRRAEQLNKVYL